MVPKAEVAPLFAPLHLGNLSLPNRIVMSPMTRSFSPGAVPGADVAGYYRRRAEGGVGLIITEGVGIEDEAAIDDPNIPHMYGQEALDGWRSVTHEVHAAGGLIAAQLWHQGALRDTAIAQDPQITGLRPSGYWGTPGVVSYSAEYVDAMRKPTDPLSDERITALVAAYARAAASAKEVGFDAVELHGAHGYLIDTFLWADTNRRDDRWRLGPAGLAEFAAEVVRAVRLAVGPDFPVIFRFSQHKQQDYKARLAETPEALGQLLQPIAEAGVDIFDASARRFHEPAFAGDSRPLAAWAKEMTGRPTIAVGSAGLTDEARPTVAADMIAAGMFDMLGVGRGLLQDPQWSHRVMRGETLQPVDRASYKVLT